MYLNTMLKIKLYFLYYRVPGVTKRFRCASPVDYDHGLTHGEATRLLNWHKSHESIDWVMRPKYVELRDTRAYAPATW